MGEQPFFQVLADLMMRIQLFQRMALEKWTNQSGRCKFCPSWTFRLSQLETDARLQRTSLAQLSFGQDEQQEMMSHLAFVPDFAGNCQFHVDLRLFSAVPAHLASNNSAPPRQTNQKKLRPHVSPKRLQSFIPAHRAKAQWLSARGLFAHRRWQFPI